jgi:Domain of unknown function (DUF1707)
VTLPTQLASDADREVVAGRLRTASAEGRLDPDELEQRVAAAYGARTVGDLARLTADLPATPAPHVPAHRRAVTPAVREKLAAFIVANAACIGIWLVSGGAGDFWPRWVLLATALALLATFVKDVLGGDE